MESPCWWPILRHRVRKADDDDGEMEDKFVTCHTKSFVLSEEFYKALRIQSGILEEGQFSYLNLGSKRYSIACPILVK